MSALGYEFLRHTLGLSAFAPERPAILRPVTRVMASDAELAVPAHVAPKSADPLEHVLFALKHEGTNLQVLAQALARMPGGPLVEQLRQTPNGTYIRTACFLWEHFNESELEDLPIVGGPTHLLFDPERYITGTVHRDPRWRVGFNGLGSMRYCATVECTEAIQQAIRSDILGRTRTFIQALGKGVTDRALAWAYLHETQDSFAIEREAPNEDKARAFIALLHQAHDAAPLSEDYLVALQNSVLTNPFDKAASFRGHQNHLLGPARGAAGVTYIPPPPSLARELMEEFMSLANSAPREIDPIVAASVASFGFVFIHPFVDGNGRLSRFLFHHALCQSGKLERGLLLPVSVAMKCDEAGYLKVLQQYSRQARDRWSVRWIDEGRYELQFNGDPSIYRYWNATKCTEFGYRMAEQALEVELRQETEFLAQYDEISRAVEDRFDVRNNDLATLILTTMDNGGVVSKRRRKQFENRVPEQLFSFLEDAAKRARGIHTSSEPEEENHEH